MLSLIRPLAFIVALLCLPVSAYAEWTDWLTSRQYQSEFNWRASKGWYPTKISANVFDGEVMYKAKFKRTPAGRFRFAMHHGISSRHFEAYKAEYGSRGYRLIYHARLNYDGRWYNQGIWVQR